jgi:hypothetical protein
MKTETGTTRGELYLSGCCLFEKTMTKNQTITRCLMSVSGQKPTLFRRILQRLFGVRAVCRCECHRHADRPGSVLIDELVEPPAA